MSPAKQKDPEHNDNDQADPENTTETTGQSLEGDKKPNRWLNLGLARLDRTSRFWSTRSRIPSLLLAIILLLLVAMVTWAATAKLDHVIRGNGEVVTAAQTQRIQSLEGGILRRLHVKEGDLVEAGALLAELDPTQSQSSYGQMRQQQLALQARLMRLEAEHNDEVLDFSALISEQAPEVVAAEYAAFRERREVHTIERQVLREQVAQQQTT